MTPRQRLTAKIDGLPYWQRRLLHYTALATAIITLAAFLRPVVGPVAKAVIIDTLDSSFVPMQQYRKASMLDSIAHRQQFDRIDAKLSRMDSSVACLRRRKPDWC